LTARKIGNFSITPVNWEGGAMRFPNEVAGGRSNVLSECMGRLLPAALLAPIVSF